jgi:flagella synthesis protein FlgN
VTTPDLSALRQRLLTLLIAETQQVNEFIALLEQERNVLSGLDVEPLFALSEQKSRFARQLQQLGDSRVALLHKAGLPNDKTGIERLISTDGAKIWATYLAAATQARQLNQENGKHITERLSQNHQALAILLAHSDQPTVYGPDGSSRTRPGSRLLGSY